MFVILTSKPGKFRTELVDGLRACETYDYLFYGRQQARFVIAELQRDVKVRVIDEAPPMHVNDVPSKFLAKYATVEDARAELRHLTSFGRMRTALERVA
jgi:hypothetical protein